MDDLKKIRRAVSKYFGKAITVKTLEKPGNSKTLVHAKEVGVYIAHKQGHEDADIAKLFGYKNDRAVKRVFAKASKGLSNDYELQRDVDAIIQDLSASPD